jgi:hypothetical protein
MDIRQALIAQGPSLALQRSAADEIARLDRTVETLAQGLVTLAAQSDGSANSRATAMSAVAVCALRNAGFKVETC